MNEKKAYIIMYAGWVVAVLAVIYMLCRADIQNNGAGTNPIGNQLSTVKEQQQQATERITESIDKVERIQSVTTTDATLIGQCQQILAGIRQRGKS